MKSFTAKEFSRCPAKVYEAAREHGIVEITHDRFGGVFTVKYNQSENEYWGPICSAMSNIVDNGDGTISFMRPRPYEPESGLDQLPELNKKAPD